MSHPVPVEKKRLLGNPGHQKLPAVPAIIPKAARTPRPARKLTDDGRKVWRRVWRYAANWLSEGTDLEVVTRYVEYIELRAKITEEMDGKLLSTGYMGQPVLNPLARYLVTVDKSLLTMEAKLGFTPADRSRIGAAEVKAASTIDDLNARREARMEELRKRAHDGDSGTPSD